MEVQVPFGLGLLSRQPENRYILPTEAGTIRLIYYFGGGLQGFEEFQVKVVS